MGGEGEPQDPQPSPATPLDDCVGPHTLACGHKVHAGCFARYMDSLARSHRNGRMFEGMQVKLAPNPKA